MECEVCGNESDDTFQVVRHVGRHTFDTFECAIFAMAPVCAHCGVRVIGHPVSEDDHTFCCSHCAEAGPHQREGGDGSESEHAEAASGSNPDENDQDENDQDENDEAENDEAEGEEDGDEEEDEGEEEGDEPSDQDLEKLDERISQARQSADDLLSSPEDEEEQDEGAEDEGDEEEGEGDEKEEG